MNCPSCGSATLDNAANCGRCGNSLPSSGNGQPRQRPAATALQHANQLPLDPVASERDVPASVASPGNTHNHAENKRVSRLPIGVMALVVATVAVAAVFIVGQQDAAVSRMSGQVADLTEQRNQLEAERDKLVSQRNDLTAERDRLQGQLADLQARTATPVAAKADDPIRIVMRGVVQVGTDAGSGTAFKIRTSGGEALFVTNAHVVKGAKTVSLAVSGSAAKTARVIGRDDNVDLALVAAPDDPGIATLSFGDSAALHSGDALYVIGFAMGTELKGEPSVTRGVVSGRRTIGAYEYLQTDAAINPGNSGGPVINATGEVIGIATAGVRDGYGIFQGINFAIPASVVQDVTGKLAAR